tara:strand:- start:852 stop:1124 length:273 start_codon:yes stop_codon:yes gene_type:complete
VTAGKNASACALVEKGAFKDAPVGNPLAIQSMHALGSFAVAASTPKKISMASTVIALIPNLDAGRLITILLKQMQEEKNERPNNPNPSRP